MVACGLVSKRAKPEAVIVAQTKGADHA